MHHTKAGILSDVAISFHSSVPYMCPKPIRRRLPKHRKQVRQKLFSFSTTAIERLVAEEKDYYVRDSKTPGLNLKVTPAGKKVFLLRYDILGRRGRKLSRCEA